MPQSISVTNLYVIYMNILFLILFKHINSILWYSIGISKQLRIGVHCMKKLFANLSHSPPASIYIQREFAKQNIKRLFLVSIFSLFMLSAIFFINLYAHTHTTYHFKDYKGYVICYILIIAINIFTLIYAFKHRRKQAISIEQTKNINAIIFLYVWITLLSSCYISNYDQQLHGQIVIYLVYAFLCSCVVIIPLRKTMIPILFCTILLSIAIIFNSNFITYGQFNLILLLLITVLTLSLNYLNYRIMKQHLEQNQRLVEEKQVSKMLTKELRAAAYTDELTNLSNRRGYLHHLDYLQTQLPCKMTVLMIDIDCFKKYNDYYGHAYGDIVLAKVASTLHDLCAGPNRFASRWGGEEFLVLLQNHTENEVHRFYKQFLNQINSYHIQHVASETADYLTFSIGGNSQTIIHVDDMNTCILHADEAQYMVKHSTKNDFVLMENGKIISMPDSIAQCQ